MKPTECIASPASRSKAGFFAPLHAALRGGGSGALSINVRGLTLAILATAFGALAFVSAPALAAGPEAPEVTVESVRATEATFHGVISPKAATFPVEPGTYQFLYRPSATNECQGAGEIFAPASPNVYFGLEVESVFEPVTGLIANTEYAVCLVVETTGGKTISAPVMFTTALPPEAPETSSPAESITATTAVLEGVLNPHSKMKDGWYFLYSPGPECAGYGASALEPEVTGEAVPEHAEVTDLAPHTKYVFCMVASNAAGEVAQSATEVSFETPPAAPVVLSESASTVAVSTARLEGFVNPSNEATECHFEYGAVSVSEHVVPCEQPTLEGIEKIEVAVNVAGLTQDTTYRYRILAKNATGAAKGKEEEFTTGTPEVPETKAATEIEPFAARLNGVLNPNHAGEAGASEFVYRESMGGAGDTECQGNSEKTTGAIAANGVSPEPVDVEVAGLLPGATYIVCLRALNGTGKSALGNAVSFSTPPVAPTVSEEFVDEVSSGSASLHGQVNPGGDNTTYRFEYGVTTSYGESIGGEAGARGEPVAVEVGPQNLKPGVLYHYRLVADNAIDKAVAGPDRTFTTQTPPTPAVLPDDRAWEMVSPPNKNGGEVSTIRLVGGGDFQAAENGDAITYITSLPISQAARSNPFSPQVISRRGPDGWISEDLATPHDRGSRNEYVSELKPRIFRLSEYWAFSPDLSLAFVEPEAKTPLVPGQPAPEDGIFSGTYDSGYVRDMTTSTYSITKLTSAEWLGEQMARAQGPPTCDASTSPAKGVGVDAVSRDGCYVYFNSESILTPGASGPDPLYVSHYDNGGWTTTFISSLSGTGAPDWSGNYVELSPNGRYVAFMSELSLTGYDNRDAVTGEPDEEVYLDDAVQNRLVCASCNPSGARPTGQLDNGELSGFLTNAASLLVDPTLKWEGRRLAGVLPDWSYEGSPLVKLPRLYQPRYVTDSGTLFFDSPDKLVARDVNGLENVYEYEPGGAGGCVSVSGCVSLISSGTSNKESAFVDASASGDDAFFITGSRLTSQDVDDGYDIYDAHVCSASVPCNVPPVSPPACETSDSCKQAPTPQSAAFGVPASSTFAGAGNVAKALSEVKPGAKSKAGSRKKCSKGFRRDKRGRCVRQKTRIKAKRSSRRSK